MAIKGQKFKSYTEELKMEAIRLHIEDKWTYRQITEHLGIQVKDRMKVWMRQYRKKGQFGLLDSKGKTEDVTGLIVHSDQGFQYTSYAYHDMLQQVGAQISMSRRGNCVDNASMESYFSHLKTEGLYPYDIRTMSEAKSN